METASRTDEGAQLAADPPVQERHGRGGPRPSDHPEVLTLHTVGIDIGSTTTHLLFSRLVLERDGRRLSSAYRVVERVTTYESPVSLTPYQAPSLIDVDALGQRLDAAYAAAGLRPDAVDTGAVIITGEAAMKENAEKILALFSARAGNFVCATAGPHLEASLAAQGSGLLALSKGRVLLNLDIGGGTAKFAVVADGRVVQTAAMSVGARLVAWDDDCRVTRAEASFAQFVDDPPLLGARVTPGTRAVAARGMADALLDMIEHLRGAAQMPAATRRLLITDLPAPVPGISAISLTGGVSEYFRDVVPVDVSDLGPELAAELKRQLDTHELATVMPDIGIRATVVGASQYSVQVSGNTLCLPELPVLPIRDVPVVPVDLTGRGWRAALAGQVAQGLVMRDLDEGMDRVAYAVRWPGAVDYATLRAVCAGLAEALPRTCADGTRLLVVLLDADVAGMVGGMFRELGVACPVLAVDQVHVGDWGYVDIGEPQQGAVPVVVKSLVFR